MKSCITKASPTCLKASRKDFFRSRWASPLRLTTLHNRIIVIELQLPPIQGLRASRLQLAPFSSYILLARTLHPNVIHSFANILPRSGNRPHKIRHLSLFFLSFSLLFNNLQVLQGSIYLQFFQRSQFSLSLSKSWTLSLSLFLPKLVIFKSFFFGAIKQYKAYHITIFLKAGNSLFLFFFHSWQSSGPFSLSYKTTQGLLYQIVPKLVTLSLLFPSKAGDLQVLLQAKTILGLFHNPSKADNSLSLPKLAISRSFLELKQYKAHFTILPKPATLFLLSSLSQQLSPPFSSIAGNSLSLPLSLPKMKIFRPFFELKHRAYFTVLPELATLPCSLSSKAGDLQALSLS